jgi:hypothetical protein
MLELAYSGSELGIRLSICEPTLDTVFVSVGKGHCGSSIGGYNARNQKKNAVYNEHVCTQFCLCNDRMKMRPAGGWALQSSAAVFVCSVGTGSAFGTGI